MNKSKINLLIDAVMFLFLMAMAGLGFLMKYVLIPGFKRNEVYGSDVELYFFNLDRHQWGDIHLILSFIFLFILLLHIILHWGMIKNIFSKMIVKPLFRIILTATVVVVSLIFALGPLFLKPKIENITPHYRNKHNSSNLTEPAKQQKVVSEIEEEEFIELDESEIITNESPDHPAVQKNRKQTATEIEAHDHYGVEIYGSMTLKEVATKYNLTVTELEKVINIPENMSGERLGRLRRQYGFSLDDLREYVSLKIKE